MKILMLITELAPGGAEKIVCSLSHALKKNGHEIVIVSLKGEPNVGMMPDFLKKNGIRVSYLNAGKTSILLPLKLRNRIRQEAPDLIHAHLIHPNILSRLASAGLGIPLVNTIHIAERRTGKFFWFLLDKWTFSLCSAETAVSHASAEFHREKCGLPAGSIRVIYNGSDPVLPLDASAKIKLLNEWNLEYCTKIVGAVGRFDFQKGFDRLLSRMEALDKRVPRGEIWGVLILGDGAEMEKLRSIICSLKLENIKIVLPGFRPDASSLLEMFDVFVMPSRYEGYGLTLTEAFLQGLPVVCSNADSLPELCSLYHGTSILVDFDDDPDGSQMAEAIVAAVNSGKNEPQQIQSVESMTDAYESLYKNLISSC